MVLTCALGVAISGEINPVASGATFSKAPTTFPTQDYLS
jgi:hypothetical protein